MIEMQHHHEPEALRMYRHDNPGAHWQDKNFLLVKEQTRHVLHQDQDGLCVYCEKKIGRDDGHVEHIKPKGKYPDQTFVYDNLAHSCNGPKHCGQLKQNKELTIEPRPGCNRYFELMARDGFLVPASELTATEKQQVDETLNTVLGLNIPKLTRQRKQFADILQYLSTPQEITEFLQTAPFRWSLQGI
jgi:uncharacterized protein (TIGR02646 family)